MAKDDWYRNKDWNAEIEEVFEQKLRRARDKSQYLRIQASYLTKTHPKVALDLIDRYFGLGEHFDMASAYLGKAEALIALNDIDGALVAYEAAIQRERQYPKLITQAYLDFPCFVLANEIEHMYARALYVLENEQRLLMFPDDRYRAHGARALLLHHFKRTDEAQASAAIALAAAKEVQSGFHYHQKVGTVRDAEDEFYTKLAALSP